MRYLHFNVKTCLFHFSSLVQVFIEDLYNVPGTVLGTENTRRTHTGAHGADILVCVGGGGETQWCQEVESAFSR